MTQGNARLLALLMLAQPIALVPAAASAAPPTDDPAARFKALDANGDDVFDLREQDATTAARFRDIDRGGNGRFGADEYLASIDRQYSHLPPGSMKGLVPMGMEAMDRNRDGTVTAAEYAAHARASFDVCDADRNGRMTLEELRICSSPALLRR